MIVLSANSISREFDEFARETSLLRRKARFDDQNHANSILRCLPTARANCSNDSNVIDVLFGSSKRSRCDRLVCNLLASRALLILASSMISASWRTSSRLCALAETSSRIPSSSKKSSKLLPVYLFMRPCDSQPTTRIVNPASPPSSFTTNGTFNVPALMP